MDTTAQKGSKDLPQVANSTSNYAEHSGINAHVTTPTCVVSPYTNNHVPNSVRQRAIQLRREREFIPENKKNDEYWDKRRRNNEAARKCREKRRIQDSVLEDRIKELVAENCQLRNELIALKRRFGVPDEQVVELDANGGGGSVYQRSRRANLSSRKGSINSIQRTNCPPQSKAYIQERFSSSCASNNIKEHEHSHVSSNVKEHSHSDSNINENSETLGICAGCPRQSDTPIHYLPSTSKSFNHEKDDNLSTQSKSKEDEDTQYEYIF